MRKVFSNSIAHFVEILVQQLSQEQKSKRTMEDVPETKPSKTGNKVKKFDDKLYKCGSLSMEDLFEIETASVGYKKDGNIKGLASMADANVNTAIEDLPLKAMSLEIENPIKVERYKPQKQLQEEYEIDYKVSRPELIFEFVLRLAGAENTNAVFLQYEIMCFWIINKKVPVEDFICDLKNAARTEMLYAGDILIKTPMDAFATNVDNKRKYLLKLLKYLGVSGLDIFDCTITDAFDLEEAELLFNGSIETLILPPAFEYKMAILQHLKKENKFKSVKS